MKEIFPNCTFPQSKVGVQNGDRQDSHFWFLNINSGPSRREFKAEGNTDTHERQPEDDSFES